MTTLAFDTLKFANRLKSAGVPAMQAEAKAEALAEAMAETGKALDLATKSDLLELERRISRWVIYPALAQIGLLVGLLLKASQ